MLEEHKVHHGLLGEFPFPRGPGGAGERGERDPWEGASSLGRHLLRRSGSHHSSHWAAPQPHRTASGCSSVSYG